MPLIQARQAVLILEDNSRLRHALAVKSSHIAELTDTIHSQDVVIFDQQNRITRQEDAIEQALYAASEAKLTLDTTIEALSGKPGSSGKGSNDNGSESNRSEGKLVGLTDENVSGFSTFDDYCKGYGKLLATPEAFKAQTKIAAICKSKGLEPKRLHLASTGWTTFYPVAALDEWKAAMPRFWASDQN